MALKSNETPGGQAGGAHRRALDALARRGRLRGLAPRAGVDFTSNDYLGLAASPDLADAASQALARGVPVGAGGSRLLRGNHEEHEALEWEAARHFGTEAALYFGSGFAANAAVYATLPQRGDLIVHDAFIHASALDGMARTKAETVSVPHNDADAFEDAISSWRAKGHSGQVWIGVESLYSMDGDQSPLAELARIARRHDATLFLDEAHATGVLGPCGRGLAAALGLEGPTAMVGLHTCSKALGASGALVTCSAAMRDYLVNRAPGFIYATAPSPLMAAVVRRALAIVGAQPELRTKLAHRVAFANAALERACGVTGSGSHILPVIVGSDSRAVAIARDVQRQGFDVRAVRPPTVPEGTARLRIAITLNVEEEQLAAMAQAVGAALDACGGARPGTRAIVKPSPHPQPPPRYVVTGTGTGVGKTVFAAALTLALDADYWKPVQAGMDPETDTERVRALTGLPAQRFHPETYRLAAPLAPSHAAAIEGVTIDACSIVPPQTGRPLVIEGAGGLMVPLTRDTLMIDLFARWNLPVILVSRTELGTINHTLLSIEALRTRGIALHGVVFVGDENGRSETSICEAGHVQNLGRLPLLAALDPTTLRGAFARHIRGIDVPDQSCLERGPP